MIKEFSDSFESIIDFFSRHLEPITSIQTLINNNTDTSKYEQNLEKCYEILKSDIDFTNKLLSFLFKLMKILEQFSKFKKYKRLSSLKKILMPDIEYSSNTIDNYNENKEDIDNDDFSSGKDDKKDETRSEGDESSIDEDDEEKGLEKYLEEDKLPLIEKERAEKQERLLDQIKKQNGFK